MKDNGGAGILKEKLLAAGMDEILLHGSGDFSLRRVASACGVSCAAPYKHFKNKEEFIGAVVKYAGDKWEHLALQICDSYHDSKEVIAQLAIAAVKFRIANPICDTVGKSLDKNIKERASGQEHSEESIFAILALTAGTAALIRNCEIKNEPETFEILRKKILEQLA